MPKRLAAVAMALLCLAAPARADMDYQCLASCKNTGNETQSCMDQCRTAQAAPVNKKGKQEAGSATHKQFDAPKTASAVLLPVKEKKIETRTDYTCMQSCLAQRLQYGLCQQRCTTVDSSAVPSALQNTTPSGR